MRCPQCKSELAPGERHSYLTVEEDVCSCSCSDRGCGYKRPTWICPKGCYGSEDFFGQDGTGYGPGHYNGKDAYALGSQARRIEISILLSELNKGRARPDDFEALRIDGETDIPSLDTLTNLIDRQFCAIF